MGIAGIDLKPSKNAEQDKMLSKVADEINDKGYVVAKMDDLVNWARAGSF